MEISTRLEGYTHKYETGDMVITEKGELLLVTGIRFFTRNFPVYTGVNDLGFHYSGIHEKEIIGAAIEVQGALFNTTPDSISSMGINLNPDSASIHEISGSRISQRGGMDSE